ncbi:hypothetical protein MQX03_03880 [Chryseobacterium aahli]|uniref:hypothetical protein n=1 Tax=Chryseobacterium aahli TaxID=1278643 RepID=UPI001F60C570|nr:hypothetical protein [Chryseobacterium aahli]MCI3936323.1 hypothetical protein [Chryseobacterium aahli]
MKTVTTKYNEIPASLKQGFSVMDGDINAKDLVIRPDNEFDLAVTANLFINGSVSIIIFCNNFLNEENPKYNNAVFIVDGEKYIYKMQPAEQHYNDALKTLMVSQQPVDENIFKLLNHIVTAKTEFCLCWRSPLL